MTSRPRDVRCVELIGRKRDGGTLEHAEYRALIAGYLEGTVTEGQMAAFLMAGVLRGFSFDETLALTRVMVESGRTLDTFRLRGPTIDKHSTGGVGDSTTLLVAPLLAAAGAQVVKLSGRALGHSGGTLDKLEAIPGLRTDLEADELLGVAADVGCVVTAQTDLLVPADRALYALRDVTATVESSALIASSVMSKKLASGADTIVLDVKCGDGAFMATVDAARQLAQLCVAIGQGAGRQTVAAVSAMDTPLGRAVGNALEVAECVGLLAAAPAGRLADVALRLAGVGLCAATGEPEDAIDRRLRAAWESGRALERLRAMVAAQGGDPAVCDVPAAALPRAPVRRAVTAGRDGAIVRVPARAVGLLCGLLGAARSRQGDTVDPAVGVVFAVGEGDLVDRGALLATVHAASEADAEVAATRLTELIEIGEAATPAPTILDIVRG